MVELIALISMDELIRIGLNQLRQMDQQPNQLQRKVDAHLEVRLKDRKPYENSQPFFLFLGLTTSRRIGRFAKIGLRYTQNPTGCLWIPSCQSGRFSCSSWGRLIQEFKLPRVLLAGSGRCCATSSSRRRKVNLASEGCGTVNVCCERVFGAEKRDAWIGLLDLKSWNKKNLCQYKKVAWSSPIGQRLVRTTCPIA